MYFLFFIFYQFYVNHNIIIIITLNDLKTKVKNYKI